MLEFQDGKIEFDGCFGISRLEIVLKYFRNDLPALLHQVLLFILILYVGKSLYIPRQLPDLGKGFNDGQGRPNCLLAFKDGANMYRPFSGNALGSLTFPPFIEVEIFDFNLSHSVLFSSMTYPVPYCRYWV